VEASVIEDTSRSPKDRLRISATDRESDGRALSSRQPTSEKSEDDGDFPWQKAQVDARQDLLGRYFANGQMQMSKVRQPDRQGQEEPAQASRRSNSCPSVLIE